MSLPDAPAATADVAALILRMRGRYRTLFQDLPFLAQRLASYLPDFLESYRALYPDATDAEVMALLDTLMAGLEARDADLIQLDQQRKANPAWFQGPEMVGMMLYVDLFAGNLAGVAEKISYLRELGVTYLHLMPLLKPRPGPNDGGYAVADYRAIDPRLGTTDALRDLARRLHAAGIHLVIDFVMNHTAQEHAWAQAALTGDPVYRDLYLTFEDRAGPDAYARTLPEVFPDFAPGNFTFQPTLGRWVWTTFYPFQWDLDYTRPETFRRILGEMLFLANLGVDVLRLDAVPFMWKRLGTNSQNQPEVFRLVAAYRALVRIVAPGVLFKAEAIVAPEDLVRYLGVGGLEGKACDVAYHATLMCHLWHAVACENTQLLRTTLQHLPEAPKETTWINYVRCHDDIGWGISNEMAAAVGQDGHATRLYCADFYAGDRPGSFAEGYRFQPDPHTGEARTSGTAAALAGVQKALVEADDDALEAALGRFLLLHGVIYFMRGIPLLYSGDEVGQLNDFSYLQNPEKAADNRWVHRPAMNWAKADRRHMPGTPEQRIFHGLKRLAEVRRAQPALDGRGDERVLSAGNDHLFVVHRHFEGHELVMAANVSGAWQHAPLGDLPDAWQEGDLYDALGGQRLRFTTGELAVPPYGCLWLAPAPAEASTVDIRVPVRLEVEVETVPGEEIYLTGSLDALGNWDPARAAGPLDASDYPVWKTVLSLPAGSVFAYQWLKKRGDEVLAKADEVTYATALLSAQQR